MIDKIRILMIKIERDVALMLRKVTHNLGSPLLTLVDNPEKALRMIRKGPPTILIIGIHNKSGVSGIEIAKQAGNLKIPVIFIAGPDDEQCYEKARQTNPVAYLIKPVNKFTFQAALENAVKGLKNMLVEDQHTWSEEAMPRDSFFIKKNHLLHKIHVDEIEYIKSEGNYCEIIANKKFAVEISLSQVFKKLPDQRFIRVHQRYLVQADLIDNIDLTNNLIYINGRSIPLGPKYKEGLFKITSRL